MTIYSKKIASFDVKREGAAGTGAEPTGVPGWYLIKDPPGGNFRKINLTRETIKPVMKSTMLGQDGRLQLEPTSVWTTCVVVIDDP